MTLSAVLECLWVKMHVEILLQCIFGVVCVEKRHAIWRTSIPRCIWILFCKFICFIYYGKLVIIIPMCTCLEITFALYILQDFIPWYRKDHDWCFFGRNNDNLWEDKLASFGGREVVEAWIQVSLPFNMGISPLFSNKSKLYCKCRASLCYQQTMTVKISILSLLSRTVILKLKHSCKAWWLSGCMIAFHAS